jgi:hypothetical protein
MALSRGVSIDSVCGVVVVVRARGVAAVWVAAGGKLGFSAIMTVIRHRTMRGSCIDGVVGSSLHLYMYLDLL